MHAHKVMSAVDLLWSQNWLSMLLFWLFSWEVLYSNIDCKLFSKSDVVCKAKVMSQFSADVWTLVHWYHRTCICLKVCPLVVLTWLCHSCLRVIFYMQFPCFFATCCGVKYTWCNDSWMICIYVFKLKSRQYKEVSDP